MHPYRRISARAAVDHDYFKDLPPKIHELPDGILVLKSFTLTDNSYPELSGELSI